MVGSDRHRPPDEQFLFAGRYRLGEVLGRGGMAEVVTAVDDVLGRSVAVKIFAHAGPHDTSGRIDAEKRTLASLTHPNLVALYDAGEAADPGGVVVPYLVMELVDGPTLSAFRYGRALPPQVVARIGAELASALTYIHSRGVVHRDIKPANILIARPDVPDDSQFTKLTDFGIARIVDGIRLTDHGTTVGTGHYMSPEQATGTAAGPATDIYSLGLVLIECLTGRMAFEGSAVAAAIARLHRDPVVPDDVGPEWAALLTAMTARDPQNRPDAAQIRSRLQDLIRTGPAAGATAALDPQFLTASLTTDQMAVQPVTTRRRKLWIPIAAAVTALAVAVAVGWASFGSDDTPVPDAVQTSPATSTEPTPPPTTIPPELPITTPPAAVTPAPAPQPQAPVEPPASNGGGNGNGNNGNGNSGNGNSGNGNGNGFANSGNSNANSNNGRNGG
ncbi:serine/threonine protein kinase [Rhodococcus sp. 06-156-3C]|uniref:serine/threonine-protein kinase n=1 Tax=Nocardiaceae TaxID=85025 RepID=UPI000522EC63|nr:MULTISPECIES: serine/threonine-protein kinase [Rhodococcus]OZD17781.1 serine/threonine protein kinase [Rhodococcus sp. 06-156-4C]OZD21416.1 serine/threonine protein kinase [Rhodococcus sp. 06-156-4a]OZD24037.1 serine/threonine protein kinase [Rhodococcus sp. 06-156-3b]OZD25210.1 serine/threonine protein kinase [Rhodococcus sp. 06-156-3C]OZD40154.1 serine/threonine protein kinase [Rhodococcus sp. 06-156-3]